VLSLLRRRLAASPKRDWLPVERRAPPTATPTARPRRSDRRTSVRSSVEKDRRRSLDSTPLLNRKDAIGRRRGPSDRPALVDQVMRLVINGCLRDVYTGGRHATGRAGGRARPPSLGALNGHLLCSPGDLD